MRDALDNRPVYIRLKGLVRRTQLDALCLIRLYSAVVGLLYSLSFTVVSLNVIMDRFNGFYAAW